MSVPGLDDHLDWEDEDEMFFDVGDKFRSENGFEYVDSIDLDNEPYQFYVLAVWVREDGYYMATDSGCSCPTPFESHADWDRFTGPLTAEQVREEAQSLIDLVREGEDEYGDEPGPSDQNVLDFLSKIN